MQKNFDLSISQSSEEHRREFVSEGAELVAWGVCFDRVFDSSVFTMGKWLGIAYFPHLFFLLDLYFPPLLEKSIEQLLPQSPNLTFQFAEI